MTDTSPGCLWILLYPLCSRGVDCVMQLLLGLSKRIVFAQEGAEDSSAQSNVSDTTHWQADDSFKDEARSSRRRGNRREKKAGVGPSTDDSSDAEPGSASSVRQGKESHMPNGFSKVNGRPERRDRASGDSREGGWENGGERQTRQRTQPRSSPADWNRAPPERAGSAKAPRAQPRVVPLTMPLPSDKGQARAEKHHQPERPTSAAAGHAPAHRANDGRPASAHAGPSPSAAAAQAAAAAQDWSQPRAEPATSAPQAAAAQQQSAGASQEGRRRPQAQQAPRPQPSRPVTERQPPEQLYAATVEPVTAPVQGDSPASIPISKAAPPQQTPARPDAPSTAGRAPAQAPPAPVPVRMPQHIPTAQAQPVVPAKSLPQRPVPQAVDAPSAGSRQPSAEQVCSCSLIPCLF